MTALAETGPETGFRERGMMRGGGRAHSHAREEATAGPSCSPSCRACGRGGGGGCGRGELIRGGIALRRNVCQEARGVGGWSVAVRWERVECGAVRVLEATIWVGGRDREKWDFVLG